MSIQEIISRLETIEKDRIAVITYYQNMESGLREQIANQKDEIAELKKKLNEKKSS